MGIIITNLSTIPQCFLQKMSLPGAMVGPSHNHHLLKWGNEPWKPRGPQGAKVAPESGEARAQANV